MQHLVIHYSEIGTKGKNRIFFERKLAESLKSALGKEAEKVYRRYGKIIVELKENPDKEKVKEILSLLPGISSFSLASKTELDIEKIKKEALKILKSGEFKTFKVETKRSNKQFPLNSPEINREVGKYLEKESNKTADYQNPEVILRIEIGEKDGFIYDQKSLGIGGLPIGTAGKIISSLSGGIDSPVASFLMMKRGAEVIFVHVYNQTQVTSGVLTKLEDLAKQLTKIQLHSKLYIVPFEKIQKQIIMNVPAKSRMIVYRRFMMKIINKIAEKEKAQGIVTGDSLGQVASQTLENLNCIYEAASLPVFTPLIGMNKEETINIAKKINTYNHSIQPYPDCCSYLIAQHPETKGKLEEIKASEKPIKNQEKLIKESIEKAEILTFVFPEKN